MSAQYDFVQKQYELADILKAGNKILENQLYSELDSDELNQVSNQHFEYFDTHFSFDAEGDYVSTAIYGEKTAAGEIEEVFDEIIDEFNDNILTSQTLEH